MLNPTPQAQEGGDGGRGGNRGAQVTIYSPLVTVFLSLWPAPSQKWCPLLSSREGCPLGPSRLGQVAQLGSGKIAVENPSCPWPNPRLGMSPPGRLSSNRLY